MAQRRMFSKTITNSSNFLMMPQSAQNLYFHLGMNADDDGFCEHFTIMRMTDSKPDDLKILKAKGFVEIFDDRVLVVLNWKENNVIRKDRYTPSKYLKIYKRELKLLADSTNNRLGKPDDNQMATNGKPNDNQRLPQVRLGKVRLGKNTTTKVVGKPKVYKHTRENLKISECISFFEGKIQGTLDGSSKQNRQYCRLVFLRLKKIAPERDEVESFKILIQIGLSNKWFVSNLTSMRYLFYNIQRIIQTYKSKRKEVVKI